MTDGLRIESAASVILRDTIVKHMATFRHVIENDKAANQAVVATYIDGLAGAVALTIRGGWGSSGEITDATINKLRGAIARDLQHLTRGR